MTLYLINQLVVYEAFALGTIKRNTSLIQGLPILLRPIEHGLIFDFSFSSSIFLSPSFLRSFHFSLPFTSFFFFTFSSLFPPIGVYPVPHGLPQEPIPEFDDEVRLRLGRLASLFEKDGFDSVEKIAKFVSSLFSFLFPSFFLPFSLPFSLPSLRFHLQNNK
jgi:hypothetical protein